MELICFMGPRSAGKTVISQELAKMMEYEYLNLDHYMNTVVLRNQGGIKGFVEKHKDDGNYGWKSYHEMMHKILPGLLKELEKKGKTLVFDLGGGVTASEFSTLAEDNCRVLEPHSKFVLLLPSEDDEESFRILTDRERKRVHKLFEGWSEEAVREKTVTDWKIRVPLMKKIAHWIVYVGRDLPKKAARKIQKILEKS